MSQPLRQPPDEDKLIAALARFDRSVAALRFADACLAMADRPGAHTDLCDAYDVAVHEYLAAWDELAAAT